MGVLDRFSLQGRVALITAGAGPLFGSSLTEGLAQAGATVITASRSLQRNQEFAEQLRDQGYDAHGLQFDISDCQSIVGLKDQVLSQFGRLDILVNSALARDGHVGSVAEQTAEQCMASAKGDFCGLFEICRAFVEPMIAQGSGSMINISSIYGVVSNDPNLYEGTEMKQPPTYNFVKAGMINYTRYLACYYGKYGVRANCISPGGYFTDQPQPFLQRYEQRVPLGRMMDNDDIQGAVVFLASDASRYITGANLMVDGGWTSL